MHSNTCQAVSFLDVKKKPTVNQIIAAIEGLNFIFKSYDSPQVARSVTVDPHLCFFRLFFYLVSSPFHPCIIVEYEA